MIDKKRILIVDDEVETAKLIARYFERKGYEATPVENGLVGLNLLSKHNFDIIISDINMPQMSGIEFVKQAKEVSPNLIVILLTGYGSLGTAREAIKIGVNDYLLKPVQLEELQASINRALKLAAERVKDPEYHLKLKKELAEEKERLNLVKEELLTLISHELRTPITVISEGFNLLKDSIEFPNDEKIKALNSDQKKSLFQSIEKARYRLNSIVEDLAYYLNFSKGQIKLEKSKVILNEFLETHLETFQHLVSGSKSILKKQFTEEKQIVNIDKEKMLDLLSRLLNNALCHNSEGIEITIGLSGNDKLCRIEICDNGKGIKKQLLDNIFKPFQIGDINHHTKGIGIGLAICKKIVDSHEGKIGIESKVGNGTKVIVELAK